MTCVADSPVANEKSGAVRRPSAARNVNCCQQAESLIHIRSMSTSAIMHSLTVRLSVKACEAQD